MFCPDCDYSLTGLAENRCPECGEPFDPDRLRRWTCGDLPLTFGPRRDGGGYWELFRHSLFRPTRLAKDLPPLALRAQAFWHGMIQTLFLPLGMLFFALVIAFSRHGEGIIIFLFIPIPLLIAPAACEFLIAWLLSRYVEPRAVPLHARLRFWRTLCNCFSTHLLVTIVFLCPFPLLNQIMARQRINSPAWMWLSIVSVVILYGTPLLTLLWWWFCLGTAIAARGLPSWGRIGVIFLIPIIGIGAIVLGILLFWLEIGIISAF